MTSSIVSPGTPPESAPKETSPMALRAAALTPLWVLVEIMQNLG